MRIEIKPLGNDQGEEFVSYFQGLDFNHAKDWAGCYCQYNHLTESDGDWSLRTPDENATQARTNIKLGFMRGYLAYDGDKCVGWCNANNLDAYVRFAEKRQFYHPGEKTGAVMCFVIHPDYRGKGLAGSLLAAAVEGFREEGYAWVMGFPFEWPEHPERQYLGTATMFEKLGFEKIESSDRGSVYALKL